MFITEILLLCLFKQASACQPPTREICCIGPGIVDSWEKELYIMLDIMYIYIYLHISKYIYVYFEGLHENHVMLTSFALTRMVGAARSQPKFLRKLGPNFQNTGLEIEPRFPAKPLRRKSVPNLGRSWRESSPATFRLQACAPPTRPNSSGQHGHTSSFATWPSPPAPARPNPKSKLQTARLDFGFWISDFGFWILDFGFRILDFGFWISDFGFRILDFGFWISDFGFRILDQFSLRSFRGGPKRPRLDFGFRILGFGFWISDFGFWILDFGFWILDFGLGLGSIDTVWILHKIFASHADSGRRIHYLYTCIDSFIRIHPHAIWIRNIAWRHMNSERVHSVSFPWISFGCFSSAVAFSLTTFHALHGQK